MKFTDWIVRRFELTKMRFNVRFRKNIFAEMYRFDRNNRLGNGVLLDGYWFSADEKLARSYILDKDRLYPESMFYRVSLNLKVKDVLFVNCCGKGYLNLYKSTSVMSDSLDADYDSTDTIALCAKAKGYKAVFFFNVKENGLNYKSNSMCVWDSNCIHILSCDRVLPTIREKTGKRL